VAYSREKVNWKEEEHVAAENADKIYEAIHEAVENGLGPEDLAVVGIVFKPSMAVWGYLAAGSKAQFAKRLIALGTMLERDNDFIGAGDQNPNPNP